MKTTVNVIVGQALLSIHRVNRRRDVLGQRQHLRDLAESIVRIPASFASFAMRLWASIWISQNVAGILFAGSCKSSYELFHEVSDSGRRSDRSTVLPGVLSALSGCGLPQLLAAEVRSDGPSIRLDPISVSEFGWSRAAYVQDKPVRPADLIATIYRTLGIDPAMRVPDTAVRTVMALFHPNGRKRDLWIRWRILAIKLRRDRNNRSRLAAHWRGLFDSGGIAGRFE